jgi:AcrR family transcriptional regulator
MDAAQQLFLKKGIGATSIDEIVTAAHVAKGTFYLYFASKEELLTALQERFVVVFLARLDAAMQLHGADQWRARLNAWIKTLIEGYVEQVALHDVIFHEIKTYDRRAMSTNPVIDHLTALLSGGTEAGAWIAEEPRTTAIMFFHALHGVVDAALADHPKVNRAKLIRTVTAFMERALDVR